MFAPYENTMKNDFSKFTCFVRGVIESGWVIKTGDKVLHREAQMHFNRLLHHAEEFEKFLHKGLGPDMAKAEDDINTAIVDLVWKLYDLDTNDRARFIDHINNFDTNEAESTNSVQEAKRTKKG